MLFTFKILAVLIFAFCYIIGGRANKWIRRILGSLMLGIFVVGFSYWQRSYSNWLCCYPLLLFIALSKGYGANDNKLFTKIHRRFSYGLLFGLSCAPVAIVYSAYYLWAGQLALAIVASMFLGIKNPFGNAVDEEGLIAIASIILVPFMITQGVYV